MGVSYLDSQSLASIPAHTIAQGINAVLIGPGRWRRQCLVDPNHGETLEVKQETNGSSIVFCNHADCRNPEAVRQAVANELNASAEPENIEEFGLVADLATLDCSPVPVPTPQLSKNIAVDFDAIPDYLKGRTQWLLWRLEKRGATTTKVPYQPNGAHAKSNERATWSEFVVCQKAFTNGSFGGVGYAMGEGDGLVGIDIDHCYAANGMLMLWAQKIIDQFKDTYVEKSPSGEGLHIWCLGTALKTGSKKDKYPGTEFIRSVELYDFSSPRYLTVTGNAINRRAISNCQSGLDWIYETHFADKHNEPTETRTLDGQVDLGLVRQALESIPSDDYKTWIDIGHALKAAGVPMELFEEWSRKSGKYEQDVCAEKWATFKPTRIGLGTMFHIAKQHGFCLPAQPPSGGKENNPNSDTSSEWPAMIPFLSEHPPADDYPFEALGGILQPAAEAIHRIVKSPDALCGQAILSAAILACAGLNDVEIDGRRCPNTDFLLSIGVSGERKSATDTAALEPHRAQEEILRAQCIAETKTYKAAQKKSRSDADSTDDPGDPPVPPVLIVGDTTIEGLQNLFSQGLSRVGIITTEAGNFLGGWSMQAEQRIRTAASLSTFWDGRPDPRARGTTGLSVLANRRVTAHFGCQPLIAASFLGARDLQSQGLLSRFLPAWPTSTIGGRLYESQVLTEAPGYKKYQEAMGQLLARELPISVDRPGELKPATMSLSPKAKALWIRFYDSIEKDSGRGGKLFVIQFFACKAAEHSLRLAGALAAVAGEQQVSSSTMANAIELTRWYIKEWQRIQLVCRAELGTSNAIKLLDWLKGKRLRYFTPADAYQKGPAELRVSSEVAHAAIEELHAHHMVRPVFFKRDDGKKIPGFEVRPDA